MNLQSFVFIGNASMEASLPLFNLDSQTFLLMIPNIISFVILAFILTQFLYKPIRDYMKKRIDHISIEMRETAEINAIADELKISYEQQIKDIAAERNTILDKARNEATAHSNQIIENAKAEVQILRNNARHNITIEIENVKEELQQTIIDVSIHMAEKVANKQFCRESHEELFKKLFAETMDEYGDSMLR